MAINLIGEEALRRVTQYKRVENNEISRYVADAVKEKLMRGDRTEKMPEIIICPIGTGPRDFPCNSPQNCDNYRCFVKLASVLKESYEH